MSSTPKPSFLSAASPTSKAKRKALHRLAILPVAMAAAFLLSAVSGEEATARDLFKQDAFTDYKADPARGEYMMNAAGCASCHAPGDDLKLLSGGTKMDTFIGKFYVPNITADPAGIGGWSKADFLNAVINGVGKDGRHLYPVMPYTSYAGMKPEDVLDIQAYIETLPKSNNVVSRHELSFPYNLSATIAFWKRGNFTTEAFQPGKSGQMERGRYLVENVGACGECHTPRTLDFGLDNTRKFEGEKGLTGSIAPDITRARIASVGQEAFVKTVLTDGMKIGGKNPIADPIMKKFVHGLGQINEDDKLAIYAYLTGTEQEKPALERGKTCKDIGANLQASLVSTGATDLSGQADAFIGKYCRNCHGPGEANQGSFPAGDLTSISRNAAFVTPGDRAHSLLYTSVTTGRMPLGSQPTADEIETLGKWIDSLSEPKPEEAAAAAQSAPRVRPLLAWRNFAQAAITDIGELPQGDRSFIRYFSFRLQHNGVLPCEDVSKFSRRLTLYKAGFNKLLNSVSLGTSLVVPEGVKGTDDLLVRVDIRDLGWDNDKWDKLIADYPLGYDPASDSVLKSLAAETGTDLPIMRTDWFMANASRPTHYHALLDLPEKISDLEKKMNVDVDDNIKRRRVIRAGFEEGSSGVSDHNRMLERHDLPQGGYYWKSYDFASSRDDHNLKQRPHGPADIEPLDEGLEAFKHDGGEMIFSLPNGLQGYYLSTSKGDRLDRGPTSIVSFRSRPIGKGIDIVNGRSCFDCHADGIISKRDQLREHIERSNNFTLAQRNLLLEMYVKQSELDATYAKDKARFINALETIGAAEKPEGAEARSMVAPGKTELITWYADLYEDDLDSESLAAEFDMTPEQFELAIQSVGDAKALKLGLDWVTQLKGGSRVPRFEVEQQFPKLVKSLLGVDPLELKKDDGASTSEAKTDDKKSDDKKDEKTAEADDKKDPETPEYKDADYRDDAFKDDKDQKGKLTLSVDVKNTDVFVDEKLSFKVTANDTCELQVFYIEADGNVEIIPTEMLGGDFLQADQARTIPDPVTGELVFDTAGENETLLLFCRAGGLGDQKLSAEDAKKLVEKSGQPPARGLVVKLIEKKKAEEKKEPKLKGASAIHMVTFNVKDRG